MSRDQRQALVYSRLREALQLRTAATKGEIPTGTHPGGTAVQVAFEALAEYQIPADLRLRYAGMDRKAGRGGHGIDEGTIYVEGEIRPVKGFATEITIPIQVQGGRMLQPSVILAAGIPRIISQSTMDDLMGYSEIDQDSILSAVSPERRVVPDKQHLPRRASRKPVFDRNALRQAIHGWK